MMRSGTDILKSIHQKWLVRLWLEIGLYAIGPAVFIYAMTTSVMYAGLTLIFVVLVLSFVFKPWNYSQTHVSNYLDAKLPHL